MTTNVAAPVVRKSVVVHATLEQAFKVFTEGFDLWWPRGHHIGKGELEKAVVERRVGGRCYGREADGTECDWGHVLVWEPPNRLVLAWQINPQWQFEPDLAKASEVDVHFLDQRNGTTRIDLEHRHFERHGAGAEAMRTSVDAEGGWGSLLGLFKAAAERKQD